MSEPQQALAGKALCHGRVMVPGVRQWKGQLHLDSKILMERPAKLQPVSEVGLEKVGLQALSSAQVLKQECKMRTTKNRNHAEASGLS